MGFFSLRGEIVLQQSCWLIQPHCSSTVEDVLPTGFFGGAAQLGLPYPLDVDRGVRVLVQSDMTAITFPAAARLLGDFPVGNPLFSRDRTEHFGASEIPYAAFPSAHISWASH